CITRGDGRPASCASCISVASASRPAARPGDAPKPGGARRKIAPTFPPRCTMSNVQVSWLAPPESLAAPVTPVAPGYQEATQRPSWSSIICPLTWRDAFPGTRQQPGRAAIRHQADAAERLQEIGRARTHDHVAHQCKTHPGAGGGAVDRRHDRAMQPAQPPQEWMKADFQRGAGVALAGLVAAL